MEFKLKEAAVCADREFEMIKITPEVRAFVEESGIENGLVCDHGAYHHGHHGQ